MNIIKESSIFNMNSSFRPGMEQLRYADFPKAKKEIMTALNITSRSSWAARLKGHVEPKVTEKNVIEQILAKYGVTKNIWG